MLWICPTVDCIGLDLEKRKSFLLVPRLFSSFHKTVFPLSFYSITLPSVSLLERREGEFKPTEKKQTPDLARAVCEGERVLQQNSVWKG